MGAKLNYFDLHAVLDTLPNAVFIKDENLRFVYVNNAYESMFGVREDDVLGKTVLDLPYLDAESKVFYQKEDEEMLASGEMSHHIFQYQLSDDRTHSCLYWSGGFIQENGLRGLIGVIVDITRQNEKIAALRHQLRTMTIKRQQAESNSAIDFLTQLQNRGFLEKKLRRLTAGNEDIFSCIMFDLDHFKKVNDVFGHLEGDEVLKKTGLVLRDCSRGGDVPCRYGGEEFVLLLPRSRINDAVMVAERVRAAISEKICLPDGTHITVSAGCSEHMPGENASRVLQRADEALYAAKNTGRNRVCVWRPGL